MATYLLEAESRNISEKANRVRASGGIPAVLYGQGQNKSMSLVLSYQQFRKVFEKAGESAIIELSVGGKKYPVLVHQIQYDPLADTVSHVDFLKVDMEKEVTAPVKIVFVGVSPAVKNLAGVLDIQKHELKVRCLPKDLVQTLEVDISAIVDFHTSVHVKDVKLPSTVKVLDNPEDTVVTVTPPRAEEETTSAPAAEAAAGAAPAEGAAAPAAGQPAAQAAGKEAKK